MAFYIVRLGLGEDFICYGPSSFRDCEKQLAAVKATNEKFYPGSTTDIYKEASRQYQRPKVEQEAPAQESHKDMVEELLNLGGKI